MFHLASKYLRRRLSASTSGSVRRRARERTRALETPAEGEKVAKETKLQRERDRLEDQRQAREELASYEPWGRAGCGAPNPHGIRYTDLRAGEIYPEDELRGVSKYDFGYRRWVVPPRRRRRRTPHTLADDPRFCYIDPRGEECRYSNSYEQQKSYKESLDEIVEKRKKTNKEQMKKDLENDRLVQAMDGPWGRPGPGGAMWRNPKDVGMNFSKSMGWTNNELFNKLKSDGKNMKASSLTLPHVKKDDDRKGDKATSVDQLPDINQSNSANGKQRIDQSNKNLNKNLVSNKKTKFVKRLPNGERIRRLDPKDFAEIKDSKCSYDDDRSKDNKVTPEEAILRLTGGIEVVPLLARRRRFGARTLPSSDVTRPPPEQDCEWRKGVNLDYLKDLKRQVYVKRIQKEEHRRDSAEDVKQHHATWASWWGRPGHGAPLRGRYARSNLAQLLYAPPLLPNINKV